MIYSSNHHLLVNFRHSSIISSHNSSNFPSSCYISNKNHNSSNCLMSIISSRNSMISNFRESMQSANLLEQKPCNNSKIRSYSSNSNSRSNNSSSSRSTRTVNLSSNNNKSSSRSELKKIPRISLRLIFHR